MADTVGDKAIAALIVHGMGSQGSGFATEFMEDIAKTVKAMGYPASRVALFPLYWADITQPRQEAYYAAAEAAGPLGQRKIRQFVASALGDATAYQRVSGGGTYDNVHARVQLKVRGLYEAVGSRDVPLVVIAHSLGGHIVSNYIWDQQHPKGGTAAPSPFERFETHAGMVTFGCNIPLFAFAHDPVVPIKFPGNALSSDVAAAARWLNYYDKDDVLGWPLRPLGAAYAKLAADIEINVGNGGTSWNPLSHSEYWEEDDFVDAVAEYLCKILDAAGVEPTGPVRTAAQLKAARVAAREAQFSIRAASPKARMARRKAKASKKKAPKGRPRRAPRRNK
jgi:hypothetical protein